MLQTEANVGRMGSAVPTTNDLLVGSHHRSPLGLFFSLFYMSIIGMVIDRLLNFVHSLLQQQCFFFKLEKVNNELKPYTHSDGKPLFQEVS